MNTLVVNVVGCLLIGVLMTVITDFVSPHRLVRPFLGVGVLGGFTTFSTSCADTLSLVAAGRPVPALLYLSLTPISALGAVWIGVTGTRLAGIALGPADSPRRSDTAGGGP
jgi:CrcB protein